MFEVRDLREMPIEDLTEQEIKSRLHLTRQDMVRARKEFNELCDIEDALVKELNKREHQEIINAKD